MEFFKREGILISVLVLFSAWIFLAGLGAMPLTDPDEVFYAETAREMLQRGEFLTPYIFGEPQFEKPPLYYWLVIFSFRAFGVSEFSARFPSAIFGILGVVAVYFFGKILANKRTGFLSAVVLATGVKYLALARACVTDIVLCVFMLLGFLFFFYGYLYRSGKKKWYLLAFVFLGLAVLTKGPVAVLLAVAIIGIYLIFTKDLKRLREMPLIWGTLLFLAVSLPWYLLMYKVHEKDFIDVFFGFHNITRFLEPEHTIGDVFYYYFPVLLGGFFPWSMLLPVNAWQIARERREKFRKTNLFLIIWIFVIFIFFSLSRTKLPTYIFPIYPALALASGRFLDTYLDGGLTRAIKKATAFLSCLFPVFLVGGTIGLYIVSKDKYPAVAGAVVIAGTLMSFFMAVSVTAFLREKYRTSIIVFVMSFVVLTLPIATNVFPKIGEYESSKKISEVLLTLTKPKEPIGAETRYQRGVAFYMDREDIIDVHPHDTIIKFLPRKERVWCVIKEKNHIQLYTNEKQPYQKPTYVVYELGKKVVITNKIPSDGKYLKKRTENDPY